MLLVCAASHHPIKAISRENVGRVGVEEEEEEEEKSVLPLVLHILPLKAALSNLGHSRH